MTHSNISEYRNCNVPILLLLFNRPEKTKILIDALRKVSPPRVYVVVDGPRAFNDSDASRCENVKLLVDEIDWSCRIVKLYRSENKGCTLSVSDGISWFFSQEEEGIILEDDCEPNKSFFMFCEYLLEKYRDEPKVMHICGTNFQFGHKRSSGSYYFSRYAHVWGWASWRRAWQHYKLDITSVDLQEIQKKKDFDLLPLQLIKKVSNHEIDTWDVSWLVSIFRQDGLCIIPEKNLVINHGFFDGTHMTSGTPYYYKYLENGTLDHISDSEIKHNRDADIFTKSVLFDYSRIGKTMNGIRLYFNAQRNRDRGRMQGM